MSDLISINIQRSRERGIPSYVTYRNSDVCNLKSNINSFDDLGKIGFRKVDIKILKQVYEDVNDIDLFTGGKVLLRLSITCELSQSLLSERFCLPLPLII